MMRWILWPMKVIMGKGSCKWLVGGTDEIKQETQVGKSNIILLDWAKMSDMSSVANRRCKQHWWPVTVLYKYSQKVHRKKRQLPPRALFLLDETESLSLIFRFLFFNAAFPGTASFLNSPDFSFFFFSPIISRKLDRLDAVIGMLFILNKLQHVLVATP